jgi:hypothetical protein
LLLLVIKNNLNHYLLYCSRSDRTVTGSKVSTDKYEKEIVSFYFLIYVPQKISLLWAPQPVWMQWNEEKPLLPAPGIEFQPSSP